MTNHFSIAVDTGGTFTDCIAVDPNGQILMCKVLSNSTLRGSIVEWMDAKTFRIDHNWHLKRDILQGYSFELMNQGPLSIWHKTTSRKSEKGFFNVKSYDFLNKIIELDKELPIELVNKKLAFSLTAHEEAPILAARIITQTALNEPFPPLSFRLGTTKGTNALLERKGAKTAFVTTEGFGDILTIGTQQRPDLFALNIVKPKQLYTENIEISERLNANGSILKPLITNNLEAEIERLKALEIESVAVAFMHSYINPEHEMALKKQLEKHFKYVSISSDMSGQIKFVPRAQTTVVNAYLQPILENYLSKIMQKLPPNSLRIMTSAGSLIQPNLIDFNADLTNANSIDFNKINNDLTKANSIDFKAINNDLTKANSIDFKEINNDLTKANSIDFKAINNDLTKANSIDFKAINNDLIKDNSIDFNEINNDLTNANSIDFNEINAHENLIKNNENINENQLKKEDKPTNYFQPKDSLLSGPAGGIVGAAAIGKQSNFDQLITFDMGGTSTDVARFDGDFTYNFSVEIGGATVFSPALAIETVAAGGGSICRFDGQKLVVGPESAGAFPGPACYGAGGDLTITDVNLLLGRLDASAFGIPVFPEEAARKLKALRAEIIEKTRGNIENKTILSGFLAIANEKMADAIRKISVSKGYAPPQYALLSFGGAGGLHACSLARLLNMTTVLIPKYAGLLSAYGILKASIERFAERQILKTTDVFSFTDVKNTLETLEKEAVEKVVAEGVLRERIEIKKRLIFCCFKGQDATLAIEFKDNFDSDFNAHFATAFEAKYRQTFGHFIDNRLIEIESIRVIANEIKNDNLLSKNKDLISENNAIKNNDLLSGNSEIINENNFVKNNDLLSGNSEVINENNSVKNNELLSKNSEVSNENNSVKNNELLSGNSEFFNENNSVKNGDLLSGNSEVSNGNNFVKNGDLLSGNSEVFNENNSVKNGDLLSGNSEVFNENNSVKNGDLLSGNNQKGAPQYKPDFRHKITAFVEGNWSDIPVYFRDDLKAGATINGFALLLDDYATTVIEKDFSLTIDAFETAILTFNDSENKSENKIENKLNNSQTIDLELFTNRFMAIADNMGALLQRTSLSVNVKERLDFSCALLDADGELIANAPHIPVHLGSLGVCVRSVVRHFKLEKGDVIVTNHPAFGGSHLPDVTLISPVFEDNLVEKDAYTEGSFFEIKKGNNSVKNELIKDENQLDNAVKNELIKGKNRLIGYVANRCHHSEIGGIRPASMPPNATQLVEEGVIIEPTYLVQKGVTDWKTISYKLQSAKYPTRALSENLADLNAALAANLNGVVALQALTQAHSLETVHFYMQRLKDYSAEKLNAALAKRFIENEFSAEESMDDGTILKVKISIVNSVSTYVSASTSSCTNASTDGTHKKIIFDFTGSSAVHKGNLNATPAIVNSVVIYVLRLLITENIPLNEGFMKNVELILPENSILNPKFSTATLRSRPVSNPAVVGGNVETSQRLTDTIIKAFGLLACGQGTMNNVLFGNKTFGYYETICGGAGAGDGFNGADAVHTHMTNTRITDPEILEFRYPVRLDLFKIKRNTGGKDLFHGGNGIIRQLTFLEPIELSVLSQHRKVAPFGLNGGENGQRGKQYLILKNGDKRALKHIDGAQLSAGDAFVIETPSGGGFGKL